MNRRLELQAAIEQKRWPDVEAIAAALIQQGDHGDPPGSVEYHLGLARHVRGNYVGATHAFAEARKLLPVGSRFLADTLIAAAFNFWSYGGDRTATSTLNEFQRRRAEFGELDYHDGMAEQILGNIAMRLDNYEEAAEHYALAASRFTDPQRKVGAYIDQANAQLALHRVDAAESTCNVISQTLSTQTVTLSNMQPRLQVGFWLVKGLIEEQHGRHAGALTYAAEALRVAACHDMIVPDSMVQVQLLQARCLYSVGQSLIAREKALAAMELAGQNCLTSLQREARDLFTMTSDTGGVPHA